jgi:hypothetical protein
VRVLQVVGIVVAVMFASCIACWVVGAVVGISVKP